MIKKRIVESRTTRPRERLAEHGQSGEHAAHQLEQCDHPATTGTHNPVACASSIAEFALRLLTSASLRNSSVVSSVTVLLLSLRAAVLSLSMGRMKCIHITMGEGKAQAQCDSGGAKIIVNRDIDGLVVG